MLETFKFDLGIDSYLQEYVIAIRYSWRYESMPKVIEIVKN